MAKRSKPRASKDRKMFNVTARKTKAINMYSKPARGGIRL